VPSAEGQAGSRSALRLSPMEVPKASGVLADELRERILSGELSEGTSLPPERELVAQTGLSRATVREALRILEVQGLIRIKAGRTGGAFVQQLGKEAVASSVTLMFRGRQLRLSALLETREAIEPPCAELAARYRTEEDLRALEAANSAIADEDADFVTFLQANIDWHLAVAAASHNELLMGVMLALSRTIYASTNNAAVDIAARRETAMAHRAITDAIAAGDGAAALRRMRDHVHAATSVLGGDDNTSIIVESPLDEPAT
jgi:GntR family transcriptional repressor for pyruvate dehydrogenase complex